MTPVLLNLDGSPPNTPFPDATKALTEPDGLLAVGGDLSPLRLLSAYYAGIFPWFNTDDPILWWSPNPRCIIDPIQPRMTRSLRKVIRNKAHTITVDQAFDRVIRECAAATKDRPETWITRDIRQAYQELYQLGYAHSVECWLDGELVGGLYGIAIGQVFCGESMFSREPDGSKISFLMLCYALAEAGFQMIDGQLPNDHLHNLGGFDVERERFLNALYQLRDQAPRYEVWDNRYFDKALLVNYFQSDSTTD